MPSIGKLIEVDVRELWKHEQYDFSNWLAKDANLEYLNDILGLTLTDVDKEVYVGPYRCDLVAKDETCRTVHYRACEQSFVQEKQDDGCSDECGKSRNGRY